MILISIILILTIATLSVVIYKQRTINRQLHNEITTNSEAVSELESHTYYSESDIESIVNERTDDLQYILDDHASIISRLEDDTVNMDEIEELKSWINKGEDTILEKVKAIQDKLDELIPPVEIDEDIDINKAELAMEILEKHRDVFNNDSVKQLSIILDDGEEYCITNEKFEVDNG